MNKSVKQLGLIGYPLSHSFSKKYFAEKFQKENISGYDYDLFPLESIHDLPHLLKLYPNIVGLNVTIPYKEQVLEYLDDIDESAKEIGAVNTIKIVDKKLIGYNTDVYGFEESLIPVLPKNNPKALILGTGGAAKAVAYVLTKLGITFRYVSRQKRENVLTYDELNQKSMDNYHILVNTTPLGMYPNIDQAPAIPYDFATDKHLLYDLVYNPEKTLFLNKGLEKGATIINGQEMLILQAEKAWEIWRNRQF